MNKAALCIGGPKDGIIVSVAHSSRFMTPMDDDVLSPRADAGSNTQPGRPMAEYRLETLTTPDGEQHFWVIDELSTSEAVERLLANYRPT